MSAAKLTIFRGPQADRMKSLQGDAKTGEKVLIGGLDRAQSAGHHLLLEGRLRLRRDPFEQPAQAIVQDAQIAVKGTVLAKGCLQILRADPQPITEP